MILYFVVNTCIASDNLFATARFPCVNLRITENLPVSSRILPPVKVMFLTLEKLFSKDFPKLPVKQIIKLKIKCQIKNQEPPQKILLFQLVWCDNLLVFVCITSLSVFASIVQNLCI